MIRWIFGSLDEKEQLHACWIVHGKEKTAVRLMFEREKGDHEGTGVFPLDDGTAAPYNKSIMGHNREESVSIGEKGEDQMNNEQIERIRAMEQALNEAAPAVERLLAALESYKAVLPQLKALAEYYQSPLWMQDYDADQAGLLPLQLCRGVLTEDALWDLLGDNDRLREEVKALAVE